MKAFLSCVLLLGLCLAGCEGESPPKLGISFGVGDAARWVKEVAFMEERAKALGMDVETRFNKTDKPKTQAQDCFELIDSGIDVLILVPRDARKADDILEYAKKKNVKVVSYARAVFSENIDFFVGYDTYKIGQSLGLHLTEKIFEGNIAIFKGDKFDFNTQLLYDGGMIHIRPLLEQGKMQVVLDDYVTGWSAELAKKMLTEAVIKNGYKLDAVFAHNDILAGVAVEVAQELGLKNHIFVTGMDAELSGVRRVAQGLQDATVYMDLKAMAYTAVNEAHNLAVKKRPNVNSRLNTGSEFKIDAYLINGKLVTRENMDRILIDTGVYTREQVYGTGSTAS